MTIKFKIPAKYLQTLLLFAAGKGDTRTYLSGINLEIGAHEIRAFVTNGHLAAVFRVRQEIPQVKTPILNVILPRDLVCALGAKKGDVEVEIGDPTGIGFSRRVVLSYLNRYASGVSLEDRFPDLRRITPATMSGEVSHLGGLELAAIAKAACIFSPKRPVLGLAHNGTGTAIFNLGQPDFLGMVLGLRQPEPDIRTCPPEWHQTSVS
jgi:DNA polymerase III sliding clamp (beta) subunit (PCNA family)